MRRCNLNGKYFAIKEQIENRIIDGIDEGRRKNPQKKRRVPNLIETGQNNETLRNEHRR